MGVFLELRAVLCFVQDLEFAVGACVLVAHWFLVLVVVRGFGVLLVVLLGRG